LHKTLTAPGLFLVRMLVFLTLVAFIAAILHEQLQTSLMTNPALNGLILGVLAIGIIYSFRQVMRLYPEIRFVNAFRISDPGLASSYQPVLLAPMATMLRDRTGALSLSTVSMRTIMDSIGSRLDEARDTGRYMVGLLVFLGLLGTFWGLLETISSVGRAIGALDTSGNQTVAVFDELKAGLAAPLKGMGTAFSSSLLGLSGSLVLGFLELQASHAHNRFYNELEEWLSGITELTPGSSSATEQVSRQLMSAVFEMQRAVEELSNRLKGGGTFGSGAGGGGLGSGDEPVRDLARGVNQLVTQMRAEQKVVREWVDEQASQQADVTNVLRDLASSMLKKGS
jgi:hypothetical protein